MVTDKFDFTTLNRAAGYEAWNATFAYWLLVLHDPSNPYAQNAKEACGAMSFQYDIEGQAHNIEDLIGEPALIPSVAMPIAPVTLAHAWSPFPLAVTFFKLQYTDIAAGDVLAVFAPPLRFEVDCSTPDEKHFLFLATEASKLAQKSNGSLLLVGSPGWDYDDEGFLAENPVIQQAMRAAGFVYTARKPLTT